MTFLLSVSFVVSHSLFLLSVSILILCIVQVLDFLCANHTRQLPIDAFDRFFDAWLKEQLEGDEALQQAGPHARLELSGKKVIFCETFLLSVSFVVSHSLFLLSVSILILCIVLQMIYGVCKLLHSGTQQYALGDGMAFEAFKKRCATVLTRAVKCSRGSACGARQQGGLDAAGEIHQQYDAIMAYLMESKFTSLCFIFSLCLCHSYSALFTFLSLSLLLGLQLEPSVHRDSVNAKMREAHVSAALVFHFVFTCMLTFLFFRTICFISSKLTCMCAPL